MMKRNVSTYMHYLQLSVLFFTRNFFTGLNKKLGIHRSYSTVLNQFHIFVLFFSLHSRGNACHPMQQRG